MKVHRKIVVLAVLLLSALPGAGRGQCIDYDEYPRWTGTVGTPTRTQEIAIVGDYAYMTGTVPPGLVVADISDPAAPEVVSFLEMGGVTWNGLAAHQDYVYVANFSNGLQVVDVSNPAAPVIVGNWNESLNAVTDVIVYGSHLCVVGWGGLRILDISAPASPVMVGSLEMSIDWYGGLAISGSTLYVANGIHGLSIVNIANLAAPTLLKTVTTAGVAGDVIVSGDWAYVADGDAGVSVVYKKYPTTAYLASTIGAPGSAKDLVHVGGYLLVAGDSNSISVVEARGGNLALSSVLDGSGSALSIAARGSFAFVAAYELGLQVADFRSILPIGTVPGTPHSAFISGTTAYLGLYGAVTPPTYELKVIDIADPTRPEVMGSVGVTYYSPEYLTVVDGYAYWLDSSDGLAIMAVSDPRNPLLVRRMSLLPQISGSDVPEFIEVAGNHAFIPMGSPGLMIIDVTDRSNPVQMGILDTPGMAYTAMAVDNYVYVADVLGGLQVVDVTVPASAAITRSVATQGAAGWLDRQGDRLYVTEVIGGTFTYLEVFDIANRGSPVALGGVSLPGLSYGASIHGHHAYFPVREAGDLYLSGVAVIDISDYGNPVAVGDFLLPPKSGGADGVSGFAGGLYFATSLTQGLCLYAAACSGLSAVDPPEQSELSERGILELESAFPNPFNPDVRIRFSLQIASAVNLRVLDVLGHRVFEQNLGHVEAGAHETSWNGRTGAGQRAPSGVYFIHLSSDLGGLQTAKVVLVE
jgi:hypothetical protein